jgi:hypothetical protein
LGPFQIFRKLAEIFSAQGAQPVSTTPTTTYLLPVSTTLAANLPPVSLTLVANLPPILMTPTVLMAKFAASDVDSGGKFVTGVVATGAVDTAGAP